MIYRSRLQTIEAVEITFENLPALKAFIEHWSIRGLRARIYQGPCDRQGNPIPANLGVVVPTPSGATTARYGDYVVRGRSGGLFVAPRDVFQEQYEVAPHP